MSKVSFAAQLRRLAGAEAAKLNSHPDAQELLAYLEHHLGEKRREQIQEHLALCPDCAGTLLDVKNFPCVELRVPGHARTEADEEADWRAVEERLSKNSPKYRNQITSSVDLASADPATLVLAPPKPFPWYKAAAAVFLAATLGLLTQLYFVTRHAPKAQDALLANIHLEELLPVDEANARSGAPTHIKLPSRATTLVLILATERILEFSTYEARIFSASEGKTTRLEGLTRGVDGSFTLALPRSRLSSGSYSLELRAIDNGETIPVAEYRFQLAL